MKFRNEKLEGLLARAVIPAFRLLFSTLRQEHHFEEDCTSPYGPTDASFTYCVWHDSLLIPLFMDRLPPVVTLVGPHRDGGFLANMMAGLRITSIRGSSSRQGSEAVRQLLQYCREQHMVLTPDGPRGPRREMKPGCAFLSSRTQKAVIPTAFSCDRAWYLGRGWTNLMIPKPFARLYVFTGKRISIPEDATREQLQEFTVRIQQEMDRLNALAEAKLKSTEATAEIRDDAVPERKAA